MRLFSTFDVAGSGMSAERLRLDVIANNLANARTTRSAEGGPYRRQRVVFAAREAGAHRPPFARMLAAEGRRAVHPGEGVRVVGIAPDTAPPRRVWDPHHPDADEDGYVLLPNVDVVTEMVDMISATRAYEANVSVMQAAKLMAQAALEIGR